jgi:hypothetical protein
MVLYSSAESLRIPDCLEVIRADDFRFYPNIQEIFAGLHREIDGCRDCLKLECVELSRSVEVFGRDAFRSVADEGGRGAGAGRGGAERSGTSAPTAFRDYQRGVVAAEKAVRMP